MQFFEFEPSFIQWLIRHAGNRPIMDVGCGEGQLVRALLSANFRRVYGIDIQCIQEQDLTPWIINADATEFSLLKNRGLLLVMARPCHGPWIEKVIRRAELGSEILYIGRECYLEDDINESTLKRTKQLADVPGILPRLHEEGGTEPILCWSIPPVANVQVEYWLVKDKWGTRWALRNSRLGPRGEPWTSADEGLGYWVNGMGGGQPVLKTDEILEGPVLVEEERELDYTKTSAVKDALLGSWDCLYPTGWLSPEGVFHSCRYKDHDWFAYYCLGYNVSELEDLGWARFERTRTWMESGRIVEMTKTRLQLNEKL